jgi:hypothetical protein
MAAKEGSLTSLLKELLARILGMGKIQVYLELVSIANGTDTTAVHGDPATLSCTPHVQQLVFDKRHYGDSPLCISVCALPHQLFVHSPSSAIYHRRAYSTGLPDAMISGVKHAWV